MSRNAQMVPRRYIWPCLYFILVGGFLYLLFSHWTYDDPFITYRYAANLRGGLGFVYNPGERVLSTTTPLFTLLLSTGSILWSDLPRLAILIGSFSIAAGGLCLWDIALALRTEAVGWTALLLYPLYTLLLSSLSSETPLYLAFCLGAFTSYYRRKVNLAALFLALAVLTRPDGILVGIILVADYLLTRRAPIPWSAVALFFVITLPWFVFAWAYFGSPIPVTLVAKRSQGSMAISQRFAAGLVGVLRNHAVHWEYKVEAALGLLGLAGAFWQARGWLLFLCWPLIYTIAYSILGVSRYHWYYAPLVPGFVVAVGLGIGLLGQGVMFLARRWEKSFRIQPATSPIRSSWLTLILIAPLAIAQAQNVMQLRQHPDRRYLIYRAAGEWLADHTPSEEAAGALEVGIIGYYAGRPMVDFAGLIQPEVTSQLLPESTYQDAALWAVERYHPPYLVLIDGSFTQLEQGYVAEHCHPVQRFYGKNYHYPNDLVIYSCS